MLGLAALVYCNRTVSSAALGKTYTDISIVPHMRVGLLLGTSKFLANGYQNYYFRNRIHAALELYKAGKVDYLVVSGDNGHVSYNEPEMMRADLIAGGVDSAHIFLDYAGFRTFDSVIRLREIFSQDSAIIISQRFHNERAIFIARKHGIHAIGWNAADVRGEGQLRMALRERLARVKVYLDELLGVEPKFLGPKVEIPKGG